MSSSPEELLRSIERTREELALTVDTIAGRLDPRSAAKRGVGKVRSSVTGILDGARSRRPHIEEPGEDSIDGSAAGHGAGAHRRLEPARPSASSALDAAQGTAREAAASIGSAVRQVPTPAIAAALAALLAFAAIIAARSRRRDSADKLVDKLSGGPRKRSGKATRRKPTRRK